MRLPARIRPSDHDLKPVCSVARRGIWENLFRELAGNGRSVDMQMIDSTHVKPTAPRPAEKGEKAGCWPFVRRAQHEDPCTRRC